MTVLKITYNKNFFCRFKHEIPHDYAIILEILENSYDCIIFLKKNNY